MNNSSMNPLIHPVILSSPVSSEHSPITHGGQQHRRQNNNGMNARGKVVKYGWFEKILSNSGVRPTALIVPYPKCCLYLLDARVYSSGDDKNESCFMSSSNG